jgi:hypothetical protein
MRIYRSFVRARINPGETGRSSFTSVLAPIGRTRRACSTLAASPICRGQLADTIGGELAETRQDAAKVTDKRQSSSETTYVIQATIGHLRKRFLRAFTRVKNAQRSKTVKVLSRGYANASSGSSIKARLQKSGSL